MSTDLCRELMVVKQEGDVGPGSGRPQMKDWGLSAL